MIFLQYINCNEIDKSCCEMILICGKIDESYCEVILIS